MKKSFIAVLLALLNYNIGKSQFFIEKTFNFGLSAADNCLSLVDIDGDGDLDAYGVNTTDFWLNTGSNSTPSFVLSQTNFSLNPSFGTGVDFADLDNDGDQDACIVYSGGASVFWKNVGTKFAPSFSINPSTFGLNVFCSGIDFVDIDDDGDIDAFCIFNNIGTQFWQNIGSAITPSFSQSFNFGLNASNYGIDFIDMDKDGDLDAFSNIGAFYENLGTLTAPSFTLGNVDYGLSAGYGIRFADMDEDLDMDAFVSNGGATTYFENISTTGIINNDEFSKIGLYPNPSQGELTLDLNAHAKLKVEDSVGRLLIDTELFEGKNKMDLSKFPDGIYLISIHQNNQNKTFKFLKLQSGH